MHSISIPENDGENEQVTDMNACAILFNKSPSFMFYLWTISSQCKQRVHALISKVNVRRRAADECYA